MNVRKRLRSLVSSERGNVMVVAAACMPLIIGAAAVGVDTIQLTMTKRQLQRAADSAALAGAYALVQSKPAAAAVDRDLTLNNTNITLSTPRTVENAPTTGAYVGNTKAVRVVLATNRSTPFWGFFNHSSTPVTVEATAAYVYQGKFCMVSLESGSNTGITFTGNGTVNLGCGVATNSTASTGVSAGGSASVTASPIAAVGGVPSSSTYATGTVLLPYSPPQSDPFATTQKPSAPASCNNEYQVKPNKSQPPVNAVGTDSAGRNVYCYNGMSLAGDATLPAGTYYIAGGTLDFGASTNVVAKDVTFVLTGTYSKTAGVGGFSTDPTTIATLSMNGNPTVDLEASTSGPYKGLILYQDANAATNNAVTINGNTGSTFVGAFYFPKAAMTFLGNATLHTDCLQMVAKQITFSGNGTIQNTCSTASGASAFDGYFVKLVA